MNFHSYWCFALSLNPQNGHEALPHFLENQGPIGCALVIHVNIALRKTHTRHYTRKKPLKPVCSGFWCPCLSFLLGMKRGSRRGLCPFLNEQIAMPSGSVLAVHRQGLEKEPLPTARPFRQERNADHGAGGIWPHTLTCPACERGRLNPPMGQPLPHYDRKVEPQNEK